MTDCRTVHCENWPPASGDCCLSAAGFRSGCCEGEKCSMCGDDAAAKVSEEIFSDDPNPVRHPLTAYVCRSCLALIMGPAARGE